MSGLTEALLRIPGLVACWDFAEPAGQDRISQGPARLALREVHGPIPRREGGPGGFYIELEEPRWLYLPAAEAGPLQLNELTVLAWLRRTRKPGGECEFIAGLWDETRARRQYGLFLNLWIHDSAQQVCAHVSNTGGPTPGHRWCMDAAIGATAVSHDEWHCVGMTYDGQQAAAWLDGKLDTRPGRNPWPYPGPLHLGGPGGSDFTVGSVSRQGTPGNHLHAHLSTLALFNRALSGEDMEKLVGKSQTNSSHPRLKPSP